MIEETKKPIFTFKGLSYFYHIEQCRLRPVGFDRQGIKYFELVDLVDNKQFFTIEVSDLQEDVVVKDKYGIIRFCIHGWGAMRQMDVYVNIQKPVGIVKDGVFYDHNLIPVFLVRRSHLGAFSCFGPPTYKVTTALNAEEVGYITPEPSSIHLKFDQMLDEGPKALLVSYAVQLALAKFRFLNLNLGKVRYVYKNRDKAKEEKKAQQKADESRRKSTVAQPVFFPFMAPSVGQHSYATPAFSQRRESAAPDRPQVFVINVPEQKSSSPPQPQVIVVPQPQQEKPEQMPVLPPPPSIPQAPRDSLTGEKPDLVLVKVTQKRRPSGANSRRASQMNENGGRSRQNSFAKSRPGSIAIEGGLVVPNRGDSVMSEQLQHQQQSFADITQSEYPRSNRPSGAFDSGSPKASPSPSHIAAKLSNISKKQSKKSKMKMKGGKANKTAPTKRAKTASP